MTASIWSTVLHLTELHKAGIVDPYGIITCFQQVLKEEKENGCSCLPGPPEKKCVAVQQHGLGSFWLS